MAKNIHLGSNFRTFLKKELKDPKLRREYDLAKARLKLQIKIQALARKKGFSVRHLARKMGTSGTQIQRLLNVETEKDFRLGTLVRISQVLGKELIIDFR